MSLDPLVCTPSAGAGLPPFGSPLALRLRPQSFDCLAGTVPSIPTNDTSDPTSYASKVAYHNRAQSPLSMNGGHVAVIGDSIMEGCDVAAFSPFAFNYGIGGDTTSGVLNRLGGYTALHTARAIMLMIGINDIANGVATATIIARLTAILSWRTGPLVFCKILPTSTAAWNTVAATVNTSVTAFLAGQSQVAIVDAVAAMSSGSVINSALSIDGLHPNGAGYQILANLVRPALQSI